MIYPWQNKLWSTLSGYLINDRIPQALLLSGASGIGKNNLARSMGKILLCHSPRPSQSDSELLEPCHQCKNCLLFEAGNHPDFQWYKPEEGSQQIKIDQVRRLNHFIEQSSQQGQYKVAIISPATSLNVYAANAVLKTLEEPSSRTLIILVSDYPAVLLPTLRSRCQIMEIPLPDYDESLAWLKSTIKEDFTLEGMDHLLSLNRALRLSGGRPLIARESLEKGLIKQRVQVIQDIGQILKRKISVTQMAESWKKINLKELCDWMISWSQSLIKYASTQDENYLLEPETKAIFRYLSEKNSLNTLFIFQDALLEHGRIASSQNNPNTTMMMESLLLAWLQLMPSSR